MNTLLRFITILEANAHPKLMSQLNMVKYLIRYVSQTVKKRKSNL